MFVRSCLGKFGTTIVVRFQVYITKKMCPSRWCVLPKFQDGPTTRLANGQFLTVLCCYCPTTCSWDYMSVFWERNIQNRWYSCSFETCSVFRMNVILFPSYRSRQRSQQNEQNRACFRNTLMWILLEENVLAGKSCAAHQARAQVHKLVPDYLARHCQG